MSGLPSPQQVRRSKPAPIWPPSEPEATTLEAATFNNIETTQQEDKIYNHTPGGKASARLNAAEDRVMGPSMTLHVMPGDTVRMQVQAKYFKKAKKKDPIAGMAAIVAASVGVGTIGEAPQIASGLNEVLGLGQVSLASKDNSIPKAYINYMFFDKEGTFKKGGFKQVSEAALGSFEELTLEYVPEDEGTIMIYTANQTAEPLDVYMDDMRVAHIEGPIIRVDDYYPFGLTFNSSERSGFTTNKFLFQSQELQDDLDLGWYSFKWRNHDPAIGRFFNIDPLAHDYVYNSPYAFSENKVTNHIELEGLESYSAQSAFKQALLSDKVQGKVSQTNRNSSNMFKGKVGGHGAGLGASIKIGSAGSLGGSAKLAKIEGSITNSGDLNAKGSLISLSGEATVAGMGGAAELGLGNANIGTENGEMTGDASLANVSVKGVAGDASIDTSGEVGFGAVIGNISAEVSVNLNAVGNYIEGTVEILGAVVNEMVDSIINPEKKTPDENEY
ncbi:MAG: hypothetical protein HC819_22345 [Cyclobacteriaceae bacterium]|nr:hypothetical protein [Cyclobacteriaceae bacterium]